VERSFFLRSLPCGYFAFLEVNCLPPQISGTLEEFLSKYQNTRHIWILVGVGMTWEFRDVTIAVNLKFPKEILGVGQTPKQTFRFGGICRHLVLKATESY
jgi:hypothetical protein